VPAGFLSPSALCQWPDTHIANSLYILLFGLLTPSRHADTRLAFFLLATAEAIKMDLHGTSRLSALLFLNKTLDRSSLFLEFVPGLSPLGTREEEPISLPAFLSDSRWRSLPERIYTS